MNQEKTGKFIARLRKEKELTQSQLAEMLNTNVKMISRWETGMTSIDISYLDELSKIFKVSKEEILNGERKQKKGLEKKQKTRLKILISFTSGFIALLIVALVLMIKNNYNNCHVYSLESLDRNYSANGVLIYTPTKDYLIINAVENILNFDLDNVETYSYQYKLYSGDTVLSQVGDIGLYEHDNSDSTIPLNEVISLFRLYIEEEHNYNDVLTNDIPKRLDLEIVYLDKNLSKEKLIIPIKISEAFSNNKMFYNGGKPF